MSKNIVVTIVPGETPGIEVGGKYVGIEGAQLSYLANKINAVVQNNHGLKNNLLSVTAYGGQLTPHSKENGAKDMWEVVSFKDIILHKISGNTREPYLVRKVFPVLAMILWQQSEHFRELSSPRGKFVCTTCGHPHLPVHRHDTSAVTPDVCEFQGCYSHKILKILDPEYVIPEKDL